jgi:tripartite-type tricarboxylate transporter receptor subunit TctC
MRQERCKEAMAFLLLVLIVLLVPCLGRAQDYPTKPINLVVGFAPGASIDALTRVLASKAEKLLGQPFVVSNNGGGGGSVALGVGANEKPDGYHLQATTSVALVQLPQLRPVPYKHGDFVPIIQFAVPISGTVVKADSPWKTFKEFVDYAKKNPGKVTYGTTGVGSQMHMAMEYVAKQEGIQWIHVPYTGSAASMTAILGGHIVAQGGDPAWIPHIKEGSLRLLCIHGEKRMTEFPDVPTLPELGYGYVAIARFIIVAPRQTPKPILDKLEEAFKKAANEPEFRQTATKFNYELSYRGSVETKKFLEEAYGIAGKMIAELNIPKEGEKK